MFRKYPKKGFNKATLVIQVRKPPYTGVITRLNQPSFVAKLIQDPLPTIKFKYLAHQHILTHPVMYYMSVLIEDKS